MAIYFDVGQSGMVLLGGIQMDECHCHRCIQEKEIRDATGMVPLGAMRMILYPICSNKRCPHANDHRLACTNSNKSGQPGSIFR
jgi:hypothetical protein